MAPVDLKRQIPSYSARRGRFDLVEVPRMAFLSVDGYGDPNTAPAYADAVRTLYPVAYALKFLGRAEHGVDHVVMPLEALWWADDLASFTDARDKSRWYWRLMLMVPDWVTADDVATAGDRVAAKAPALDRLEFGPFDEGLAVQTLHVGPYDAEGPVLQRLHEEVVPSLGLRLTGRHHEVYLGDARRTAPDRLRTILRQPVARADAPVVGP